METDKAILESTWAAIRDNQGIGSFLDCAVYILELCSRNSHKSDICVLGSRCLLHILRANWSQKSRKSPAELLDCQELTTEVQSNIFNHVFRFWDHFVDVVRHESVEIFGILIVYHKSKLPCNAVQGASCCVWFDSVLTAVFDSSAVLRAKYECLLLVAETTPFEAFHKRTCATNSNFAAELLSVVYDPNLVIPVVQLFCRLYEQLANSRVAKEEWKSWLEAVVSAVILQSDSAQKQIKERLLPELLKIEGVSGKIVQRLSSSLENILELKRRRRLLTALITVCRLTVKYQHANSPANTKTWRDFVSNAVLLKCVSHWNSELSLSAFELISDHPKQSLAVPVSDLNLSRFFIVIQANEQSPAVRQKLLTGFKKMLFRIRNSSEQILRDATKNVDKFYSDGLILRRGREICACYKEYIYWIFGFAFRCLNVGANFGRKVFGLECLDYLCTKHFLRSANQTRLWSELSLVSWMNGENVAALIRLLDDEHELIQQSALNFLLTVVPHSVIMSSPQNWSNFLNDTWQLARSARPLDSHSAAYRFKFLEKRVYNFKSCSVLEESSMGDEENLLSLLALLSRELECRAKNPQKTGQVDAKIMDRPIHGLLHCVRTLLEQLTSFETNLAAWSELISDKLVDLCVKISDLVAPVVHNMSPEGYAPPDLLSKTGTGNQQALLEKLHSQRCQSILVNCWRSQREISAIFGLIAQKAPFPDVVNCEIFATFGAYFRKQLTECKHRGAFETAYEGFANFTARLWRISPEFQGIGELLPHAQLEHVLTALAETDTHLSLCATRRSAGLPFLVMGYLTTEPKARNSFSLEWTFGKLLQFAGNSSQSDGADTSLHAFNVLTALYRQSKLGEEVMRFAEPGLKLAIEAFASESWALRNAASQTFTALMRRVFGIDRVRAEGLPFLTGPSTELGRCKTAMSTCEFFSRFPNMHTFLWNKLAAHFGEDQTENRDFSMFPILIIFSKLYKSGTSLVNSSAKGWDMACFLPLLLRLCMTSKIMKLRDLTVSVLVSLCDKEDCALILREIGKFLASGKASHRQNALGASLLLTIGLSNRFFSVEQWLLEEKLVFSVDLFKSCCHYNKLLFLGICGKLSSFSDLLPLLFPICIQHDQLLKSVAQIIASRLFDGQNIHVPSEYRSEIGPYIAKYLAKTGQKNSYWIDFALERLNCFAADGETTEWQQRQYAKLLTAAIVNSDKAALLKIGKLTEIFHASLRSKTKVAFLRLLAVRFQSASREDKFDEFAAILDWCSSIERTEDVRMATAECLSALKTVDLKKLWLPLMRLLQDENGEIRAKAAESCFCLGSTAAAYHSNLCVRLLMNSEFAQPNLDGNVEKFGTYLESARCEATGEIEEGEIAERLFDQSEANTFLEPFDSEPRGPFQEDWQFALELLDSFVRIDDES